MADTAALVELLDVTKRYESPGGGEGTSVLAGVSCSLHAGESLAVAGPSGSGKSTLLNIIGALDRPTTGTVRLAGRDLADLDDSSLAEIRNREIGFIFQLHHLLPQCTVFENVLVPTLAGGSANAEAEDRARRLIERVGLGERTGYRPSQLSGGERQRVAIVRALINQPTLLLADEPTGSLDHSTANSIIELLVELNREQAVALIVVTHAPDLARRMNRVLTLSEGVLVPEEIEP